MNMYLLLIVLYREDLLDEVLSALVEMEITGAAVLDGTSMERVLSEEFVEFATSVAPSWEADGRPIYGGLIWINNPVRGGEKRFPSLPNSTYSFAGAGGQSTIIVPEHEMVIARLGLYQGSFDGHANRALQDALALLVEAIPHVSEAEAGADN